MKIIKIGDKLGLDRVAWLVNATGLGNPATGTSAAGAC
jgi:hypothetical protein